MKEEAREQGPSESRATGTVCRGDREGTSAELAELLGWLGMGKYGYVSEKMGMSEDSHVSERVDGCGQISGQRVGTAAGAIR